LAGLEAVLKVKEREVNALRAEAERLEARLKEIEERVEALKEEIKRSKEFKPPTAHHFALHHLSLSQKLKSLEKAQEEREKLAAKLKELRELLKEKRGELSLLKTAIERRKREKERRDEILTERFIYEVLYGRANT